MPISLGGTKLERPAPLPDPPGNMSAAGYAMWDCMTSMQWYRAEAIPIWRRAQKLRGKVSKNPNHENVGTALSRAWRLEDEIADLQKRFLEHEWTANEWWQSMRVPARRKEQVHEMFNVPAEQETILGLWWHPLGENGREVPPKEFLIDATLLSFLPPLHAAHYATQRTK